MLLPLLPWAPVAATAASTAGVFQCGVFQPNVFQTTCPVTAPSTGGVFQCGVFQPNVFQTTCPVEEPAPVAPTGGYGVAIKTPSKKELIALRLAMYAAKTKAESLKPSKAKRVLKKAVKEAAEVIETKPWAADTAPLTEFLLAAAAATRTTEIIFEANRAVHEAQALLAQYEDEAEFLILVS